MAKKYFLVLSFLLIFVGNAQANTGLVKISENIYSYVDTKNASGHNSFGANAGIIIGNDYIVVIDTLISSKKAKQFIIDIRKVSDLPIKYVINTHYHLDHVFGNAEFKKLGATIIAHKNCNANMHKFAAVNLQNIGNYGISPEEIEGTEIAFPQIIFSDSLTLDLEKMTVNIKYVASSHTDGSVLVLVPEEKVLFTGDIVFTDYHPYMADGNVESWSNVLDFILTIDANKIVPGHGPISGKKDVNDMKEYILTFDKKAKELVVKDNDIEKIVMELKKVIPQRTELEAIIAGNIMKYTKDKQKTSKNRLK